MVKLNLSSNEVRNCKVRSLKKGILNFTYRQGLLFEKSKQPDKFTAGKTRKSVRKIFKTRIDNEF